MAQDTKPESTNQGNDPDGDDSNFHFYSGGEVKELAGTRVAPVLWWFYLGLVIFLIIVAVTYFTGHRSWTGLTRPVGLSADKQIMMQADLDAASSSRGFMAADQLDISRIPLPAGETLDQAISRGTDVYQRYCIGCHGPNQDGNGVNAASLNPKPRNLRDAPFMQAMSYERIYTSVHKGVPGTAMPRWENSLTEDQMKNVIAYVLSMSAPTAPVATASADTSGSAPLTASAPAGAPAIESTGSAPTTSTPAATPTSGSKPATP